MKITKYLSSLVWTSLLLSACALQEPPVLQREGPTTLEIYANHMHRTGPVSVKDVDVHRDVRLNERSSEPREELQTFPSLLRNPTPHMYVFPHLATSDQVPIPGYWTVFQLYRQNHYALPGER